MEFVVSAILVVFACAVVALVVFLFRGKAIENRLAILEALAEVAQRTAQLEQAVHANASAPLERKIDVLITRLGALEGRVAAAGLSSAASESEGSVAGADSDSIVRSLGRQGYSSIRVVSGGDLEAGVREYRVEASKGELLVKGSVFVAEGTVVESRLIPIYELFP